jgi:hypothetical protein
MRESRERTAIKKELENTETVIASLNASLDSMEQTRNEQNRRKEFLLRLLGDPPSQPKRERKPRAKKDAAAADVQTAGYVNVIRGETPTAVASLPVQPEPMKTQDDPKGSPKRCWRCHQSGGTMYREVCEDNKKHLVHTANCTPPATAHTDEPATADTQRDQPPSQPAEAGPEERPDLSECLSCHHKWKYAYHNGQACPACGSKQGFKDLT